ncbi:hypothetical protein FDECE_18172 [Fusarium decemcellulare]|nr:hypothetical protein FDECE_18172 [Fusarium decemcellulare]
MEWFSDSAANSTDIDTREGYAYYRTPRGGLTPNWQNKVRFSTMDAVMNYDSFYLADMLLTKPLQVIVGSIPGSYESDRHGHIIHDMAASTQKDIVVLDGASHFDLYDRPQYVEPAVTRLAQFYKEQLV